MLLPSFVRQKRFPNQHLAQDLGVLYVVSIVKSISTQDTSEISHATRTRTRTRTALTKGASNTSWASGPEGMSELGPLHELDGPPISVEDAVSPSHSKGVICSTASMPISRS